MKKMGWKQGLGVLLSMALGAALGAAMVEVGVRLLPDGDASLGTLIAFLLALPLLFLVIVAAHEAGHILGGLIVDFRPLLFIVGPLRIEWTPDGKRSGLNRSFTVAGGLAAMAPRGLHDLRRRTMVLIAGGPAASLMFGVQCLALWLALSPWLMSESAGSVRRGIAGVLVFLGLGSLLIGVLTLVPARSDGFYSDGARMLRLLRRNESAEQEVALLALTGLTLGGTRPRDWDPALVEKAAQIRDGGAFEAGAHMFAYAHHADCGEMESARAHLEAALARIERLPPGSRSTVLLHGATFFALVDRDVERAVACYRSATGQSLLSAPHQRALAGAAIELARGDAALAADSARQALALAGRAVDRGGAAFDSAMAEQILLNAGIAAQ